MSVQPNAVIATIVAALQDTPEVVALVGTAEVIRSYYDYAPPLRSLEEGIANLEPPFLLLAHTGIAQTGDYGRFLFQFAIHARLDYAVDTGDEDVPGNYLALWSALTDGVPTSSDGLPLSYQQWHPDLGSMEAISFEMATVQTVQYWVFRFGLRQLGGY